MPARFGDSPDLFDNDPLVLDLSPLQGRDEAHVDFAALLDLLHSYRVLPIYARGRDLVMLSMVNAGAEVLAKLAKERLQIILAHERSGRHSVQPDYLPALQRDLVAVISRYVKIDPQDIKVSLERRDNLEVLEVKIELPDRK